MYFTNINNDELKHFKDTPIPFNFSMDLTTILNNSLFNVENLGNNIYRICPLFKCKEIISNNDNDKIFDTQCIITIGNSDNIYTFRKDDGDTYDYTHEHYHIDYNLGDDLTDADFNRIVYLLRKNRKHYDNIQIKHNTLINSTYGSYLFDLEDSTISDEGIIITPTTLENDCTVTLTNPVFHNSKYYLNLTVKSINNINLCTGDDYPITTDTIQIPLTRNTPVTIPFEDIELYNIISFNASIEIIHNEPVFIEESYLNLSASTNHIDIGESVTLTATYYNSSGSSADKTIIFKDNGIQIGQAITNNQGIATLTYTPDAVKSYSISADYENTLISNTVNVNVTKLTPTLLLEANTDSAFTGMSITVEGSLKYNNTVLSNESVKIYDGSTLLTTLTTDSSGEFDTTITATSSDMSLKAVFDGDNTYANVESDSISILNVSDKYMEIVWNGTTLRQSPYANNPLINSSNHDVIIDYGDGTVEISHNYGHTYSTSGEHTIKIYNITSIGYAAFSSRTGLTHIIIPDTVTTIGSNAFTSCTDLSSITIPDSVTNIGSAAFTSCTSLANITIPDSVTSIEGSAFSNCTDLSSIVLEWDSSASIISYNFSWINNCTSFSHFLIPEDTTSLYEAKNYPSNLLKEKISYDGMSLSKTAGKDILSYADVTAQGNTEFCTVTAQLTNNGSSVSASSVPVVFGAYLNDVLISGSEQTVNTNASGQASYTYTSAGKGDIVVKVVPDERSSLIQTYSIEDIHYYDSSSNDNVSRYAGNGLLVTYDTTNQAYNIKNTASGEKTIAIPNLNLLPSKVSIDFNVKSAGTLNKQIGINLGNSALARLVRANTANYIQVSDGTNSNSSNYTVSDNTWYTLESTYDGTTITAKLIQNGTVVATVSLDGSITANQVYLFKAYTSITGNDVLVKNIKIL